MLVAIDTATDQASLALHDGFRVRAEQTWEARRQQTRQLSPRLHAAMRHANVSPEQLSGVTVTTGPGSFTGLRIGMSVAKGLAMAQTIPLVGVRTLDVIASAQGRDRRRLAAVLQAGRRRISIAFYRWQGGSWHIQEEPHLTTWTKLTEELIEPTIFCGEIDPSGADTLARLGDQAVLLPAAWRLRRAGFLAELGWRRLKRGDVDDPSTLTPTYLKHPV